MKKRKLKLIIEPIFIDIFLIILGFFLLRNIKVPDENFTNIINILLAVGVGFMVMHFDSLKDIVKKERIATNELSEEDLQNYRDFLFELSVILLIVYLIFLMYLFDLDCLKYVILSLSFGLFSALIYSFSPINDFLIEWIGDK